MNTLKFNKPNAKLIKLVPYIKRCLKAIGVANANPKLYSFSKLSGHSCPFAKLCHSQAVKDDSGRLHIEDGKHTQFRCFSASQEAIFPNLYKQREYNTNLMRDAAKDSALVEELLNRSVPKDAAVIRIHVAGDFSVQNELDGWLNFALVNPQILFYAYTKSLPFWINRLKEIPKNFVLTASAGGYKDKLIEKYGLRYAKVVYSDKEAKSLALPIDHNDLFAANPAKRNQSFALLLHGIQPKGLLAADALKKLNGKGSYSR